jgi:hypothetical protein
MEFVSSGDVKDVFCLTGFLQGVSSKEEGMVKVSGFKSEAWVGLKQEQGAPPCSSPSAAPILETAASV